MENSSTFYKMKQMDFSKIYSTEDLPNEIWADILITQKDVLYDFTNRYQISNFGRVKGLKRSYIAGIRSHLFYTKNRILHLSKTKLGYLRTCIGDSKNKSCFLVHRLVATAFLKNTNQYNQVNHKNGNKYDNRVENLEWCNAKQNMSHAMVNGLMDAKIGENNTQNKLTKIDVLEIFNSNENIWDICERYKIDHTSVYAIKNGISWGWLTGKKHTPKYKIINKKRVYIGI